VEGSSVPEVGSQGQEAKAGKNNGGRCRQGQMEEISLKTIHKH
jgi:hypothetical protein